MRTMAKAVPQALKRIGSKALNVGAEAPTYKTEDFPAVQLANQSVCRSRPQNRGSFAAYSWWF